MALLKQTTTFNRTVLMTLQTDHVTGATGLTLTILASKNGGALASIAPVVTELGNGWYSLALTTAHTNTLGLLSMHITGSGADPTDTLDQVVAFDPTVGSFPTVDASGRVTTTYGLHKNTLLNNFEFPMVLSSDHVSPGLALTVAGQVSLDGVGFVNLTNAVSEVAAGIYKVNLAAADLNGTMVVLKFTATGADPTTIGIVTQG